MAVARSSALIASSILLATFFNPLQGVEVKVNREETIVSEIPLFGNGSSPGWNNGSPMIVRKGDDVWFSLSRPVAGVPPYANTIWQIYKRQKQGWTVILETDGPSEREPCPLALLNSYTLAVFVNPKTSFLRFRVENEAILWNSHPHLLAFPLGMDDPETFALEPRFSGNPVLREHTYRGLAVDPRTSEVLIMVVDPDSELYHPSYLDGEGQWHAMEAFTFPIRGLYPNLYVRGGEAHIAAVSDIKEPVQAWRDAKYRVFQRHWDYAFRHIYYSWTPDARKRGFETSLLIDSIEDRPGSARNLDLIVDVDGTAHLLYVKNRFQYEFLRDEFFPDEPMAVEIGYAQVKQGRLIYLRTIGKGLSDSDPKDLAPGEYGNLNWGRLHRLEDGSIVVIYSGEDRDGAGMWITRLNKVGVAGEATKIPMEHPMGSRFFTNTERGGSAPSNTIDLLELGYGSEYHSVRYAEIEVRR